MYKIITKKSCKFFSFSLVKWQTNRWSIDLRLCHGYFGVFREENWLIACCAEDSSPFCQDKIRFGVEYHHDDVFVAIDILRRKFAKLILNIANYSSNWPLACCAEDSSPSSR